jgi:DNA modification methylase
MQLTYSSDMKVSLGDARHIDLPDNSVNSVVTSPPYWSKRKYAGAQDLNWQDGWRGSLGLEPTPELFVSHLTEIFREVRRALRPDGVCWVNVGDSMCGGDRKTDKPQSIANTTQGLPVEYRASRDMGSHPFIKPLDCVGIPEMLVMALRADGWYWRSTIIWHKDNPMPESVNGWRWERHQVPQCPRCKSLSSFKKRVCKVCGWEKIANRGETEAWRNEVGQQQEHDGADGFKSDSFMVECPGCPKCSPNDGLVLRKGSWRPTNAFEYIFMLTKTDSYYCDREAVAELYSPTECWGGDTYKRAIKGNGLIESAGLDRERSCYPTGMRNLRNVWQFSTQAAPTFYEQDGTRLEHFAAFPEKLPELCLKASMSEWGYCPRCGAPWARVIKHSNMVIDRSDHAEKSGIRIKISGTMVEPCETETLGWRPTCTCGITERVQGVALDPFCGTGTTLVVAKRLGHIGIGIDLSEKYVRMSERRLQREPAATMRLC